MQHAYTDTSFDFEREYPKLVRDLIPDIIKQERDADIATQTLDDNETFLHALLKKLIEESKELAHSTTDENLQEELADSMEVIDAILKLKGWSREDIEIIQKEKRQKRGGFDKRILMLKKP